MTTGTLWRAAGLGLALGLFGAGDPLQAQTACGTGTGYQPSNETGHNKVTDDADWCGRTKEYWDEILGHAANKGSCQAGRRQSPIALVTPQSRDIDLFPITFVYSSGQGTRELENNGHTVELRLYQYLDSFLSRIEINERNYVLDRMHFHYPSEHTLDGERFPLELHLVHGNNQDWSVFALLVRKDPNDKVNEELNNLFRDMPTVKGARSITVEGKDVIGLLPENKRYLSYKGSLTTPGCNEGITWVVFTTPITASQAQIDKFKAATSEHPFKVNARPLNDGQGNIRTGEGRSVGLWESGQLEAKYKIRGDNGYKGLTVIPGPGAASSAYPGWFKVRRGAGSYVDVKFTSDATRETSVVTLHRTADNKIPPIKIEVNDQTVEPQQLYNAGGRFNIPRARLVQGENTLRLSLGQGATSDYEIQSLRLSDD